MGQFTIRKATDDDVEQLAEVSARAFERDPLTEWLVEDPSNTLQVERQMFLAEWRISKQYDLIFTDSDRQGVAVWKPPGASVTIGNRIRQVWSLVGSIKLSRRTLAKIRLFVDVEKAHPKEPHYYLSLLAVTPDMQGKGLGSALMQPILELCDREGIHAYLETETESNVGFYSRKGFTVRQEIITSDGKSKVWTMWREPKMSDTQYVELDEYDTVRIKQLILQNDMRGLISILRDPIVGDIGTIMIKYPPQPHLPPTYIIECCDNNGSAYYIGDFIADELEKIGGGY